jgi:fumarylpyruvate hydrolase
MTSYLFAPPPVAAATVQGTDTRFPVNRIFCVGRNYDAHAREMGAQPDKEEPFYFTKSPSTLAASGLTLPYPPGTDNFHYEMELVVAIGAPAFRLTADNALSAVYGYAAGLDMTRRDLQLRARDKGRPWDLGKDVEHSAVLGEIAPADRIGHPAQGTIELTVNGQTKQKADIAELINGVPEILAHLSQFYHLSPGDLIFTGTPAGVGPVVAGDRLEGRVEGVGVVSLAIGAVE